MFSEVSWPILFWMAVVGGAIGSFLNVVVYRLPHGLSLIHPPSHCPTCKNPVRWFDNVPVFGWILLRGRCRSCRSPIAIRYPLVEAFTALMFVAAAAVEMPRLDSVYPIHMLLLCTLLCAALIEYDRHRPPWRLYIPAIFWGLLARAWSAAETGWHEALAWPAGLFGVAALGLAVLLVVLVLCCDRRSGLGAGFICAAFCLGLKPMAILAVAAVFGWGVLRLGDRVVLKGKVSPSAILGFLVLIWVLAPRLASFFDPW